MRTLSLPAPLAGAPVRLSVLLLGLLMALVASPAAAQTDAEEERTSWGIAPSGPDGPSADRPVFEFALDEGARVEDLVSVSNFSQDDLVLQVYSQDAFTTGTGGMDVLPGAETSTGAGTWIDITDEITVPARSRVDVPFSLTVPADAEPGDHAAGIVASLTTPAEDGQMALERRVGARVYVRVAGPVQPQVSVEDVSARYRPDLGVLPVGGLEVDFTVRNTGNVRLGASTAVDMAGPFGMAQQGTQGPDAYVMLPGETYRGTALLTDVPALGPLDIEVTADPVPPEGAVYAEDPASASASGQVWAVPWAPLALLAALVLLVAVRRRRRRRPSLGHESPQQEPVLAAH
ncbi:DUF916 domain-containing protein [Ruania suaedae]|uniref:DUF916 domain-containing protein n=1 Tax=Ruania suaedae TaxID=2897774 RepID=UPI001E2A0A1D|nr:DUF916 domain-containing protein [Ruania suaedae]UFU02546.1 DUF916 domain-containing protein [Ruania suaedae]